MTNIRLVDNGLKSIKKYLPMIFSFAGAVGVFGTAVLAVKETPKALKLIEEKKKEKGEDLTVSETIQAAWKCYIPAAATGTVTILSILGSAILNQKSQVALVGACALAGNKYKEYIEKVKELFGEETHKQILEAINSEKAQDIPNTACGGAINSSIDLEDLDEDEVLFYDSFSDRYFEAKPSRVIIAEYHLNRNFTLGWNPSVNDFYEFLGLEKTDVGEKIGWTKSNGDYYWIDFDHAKTTLDNGLTCYIIDSPNTPPSPEFL